MKKKSAFSFVIISLFLVLSLTSCNFLANTLREGAEKLDQENPKPESTNVQDHVASLVAEYATQTRMSQTNTPVAPEPVQNTPVAPEPAQDTPVPSPTIESIVPPTVTSLPTQAPPTQPPSKPDKEVRLMGLSFTVPGDLDYTVTIEDVEEWPDPSTLGHGNIGAAHILFHLNPSYDHDHYHDGPRIYVFPGESYAKYYDAAGAFAAINKLISNVIDFSAIDIEEEMPFPRLFNAMQMYHSNEKVVHFQNGSGIRFLTAYHQIYAPIVTRDLFYAFIGFTDDYNYVVVAIIPIYDSPLPWTTPLPPDGDPFYDNYRQHLLDTANLLNSSSPGAFDPNLDLLDQLFESMRLSVQ